MYELYGMMLRKGRCRLFSRGNGIHRSGASKACLVLAFLLCLTGVDGANFSPGNATDGQGLCKSFGSEFACKSSCTSMGCALSVFQLKDYTAKYRCSSYLLIPAENLWSPALRSFLYMVALLYCFLGLAAITGIFMRAIEMIVSKRVEVTRRDSSGAVETFVEKYWNATIANITLLALGTSAPEILLMLIDTLKHLKQGPGELGPGTIMGSAAFNLLVILAVCVVTPKRGVVRRIEDFAVFLVELVASLWAYFWLLIILKFSSPNVIEIWEAAVTLLQFPLFVFVAFGQDRSWSFSGIFFKGKDDAAENTGAGAVPAQPSIGPSRLSQTDTTTRAERNAAAGDSQGSGQNTHASFSQFGCLASHNLKYRTRAVRAVGVNPPPYTVDAEETEAADKSVEELPSSLVLSEPPNSPMPSDTCLMAHHGTTTLTLPFADVALAGQWLPPFVIPVNDCSLPLVLEIRDRPRSGSREGVAGQVTIDLRDLTPGAVDAAWYAVKRGGEEGRAMLHIQLLLRRREADFELSVTILGIRGSLNVDPATTFGSTENLLAHVPSTTAPRLFRVLTQRRPSWTKIRTQWYLQFLDAMMMRSQTEDGSDAPSSTRDMVMHVLAFYWKVLFAFIPPPSLGGGWPTFFAALAFIGLITAIVVELATLFSCASGMHVYLTAIVFVAVGTSLPDLLASRIATQHEPTADSAIANINGSNSVNVFLGIGLPWLIAAIYNRAVKHQSFNIDGELLDLSLVVFFIISAICLSVLFMRRFFFGGELGGNSKLAAATSLLYVLLWFVFVILSGLRSYNEI